ncbi:hypothetical protein [Arenimonas daejeonensis]|uniref:hypothetical protein n=1 Tax=Arenimonas daejeonensis TaxID=370777 RepID=UPI0011BF33D5|nr:hypothetical protein [Arenimonas daejeonensis]
MVIVGTLVVNVPVLTLLFGPGFAATRLGYEDWFLYILAASFFTAWSWWSFALPRWRLWAYERVKSTGAVHARALAAGLVWPRGSLLTRTEFQNADMRNRQLELERDFP